MSGPNTNAWPFTEISGEEGLDINAIFGDSAGTADQGNPFELPAAAAVPAPTLVAGGGLEPPTSGL